MRIRYHNPTYRILVKGGKWIDINIALLTYRCEECLGKLRRHNSGLVCETDPAHKHFIHRTEAAQIEAGQAANLAGVVKDYDIVDGRIVYTGGSNNET